MRTSRSTRARRSTPRRMPWMAPGMTAPSRSTFSSLTSWQAPRRRRRRDVAVRLGAMDQQADAPRPRCRAPRISPEKRHMQAQIGRRSVLQRGALGLTGAALAAAVSTRAVDAKGELMTASGAGVNLKLMPDPDGKPVVPMRESFAFDAIYAQCIVEDNTERFAMDTFGMGRVVIEPHQFFMAMYADT